MEYAFVLRGRLRTALKDTLSPLSVSERDDSTEMTLEIRDDAQLYGVIARMERLGLSIVSFEPAQQSGLPSTSDDSASNAIDR